MLKAIRSTQAGKLGGIAATYRAGTESVFGTCPPTCSLNPVPDEGTKSLDQAYMKAELNATPRNGISWTYSHYHYSKLPRPQDGPTVYNYKVA